MKLFAKYSRVNLLTVVGVFLLSGFVFYYLVNYILIREMDADLAGIREKVEAYAARYQNFPQGHPLDEEQISYLPIENTSPAESPASAKDPARTPAITEDPEKSHFQLVTLYSPREKKMHNFRQLEFPLQLNGKGYKVTIAKPLEGLHHLSRFIVIVSLSTILLTIVAALLINRILLRRLWQPFYDTIDAMRHFKLGRNQDLRFPLTTIDEFAFMNEQLRQATEKAEHDYLLLKEFTENASHELQTPLSIIRSKLDLLIQQEELSQRQSEIVQSAYAAIKKLSRLNQSLLLLTKIGNHQFNQTGSVDLKEKVEEKLLQFQELWQTNQVQVSSRLNPASIQASPELIDILLNNLFSNASNHNIPRGSIDISLQPQLLTVRNTGTTTALDQTRVFRRFYKGEQHTGHNGLGLSIIKQICEVSAIDTAYRFTDGRHEFMLSW
jgi:signal transduction histidine kinase